MTHMTKGLLFLLAASELIFPWNGIVSNMWAIEVMEQRYYSDLCVSKHSSPSGGPIKNISKMYMP